MNRTQQVLAVLQTDPQREWSAAEVSVVLNVAPGIAGNPMRKLADQGVLTKSERGLYQVATRAEVVAHTRAQEIKPVVAAIPEPATVKVPPVTYDERCHVTRIMRDQGRPMAPALITGRLVKCGMRMARTDEVLALLEQQRTVRRLDDGRWELVA